MKTYEKMKRQEAAAALHEFLEERPRALEHLTRSLAERSGGTVNLDGTVESLPPPLALGEIGTDRAHGGNHGL